MLADQDKARRNKRRETTALDTRHSTDPAHKRRKGGETPGISFGRPDIPLKNAIKIFFESLLIGSYILEFCVHVLYPFVRKAIVCGFLEFEEWRWTLRRLKTNQFVETVRVSF